jgi:hypothetical protein
MPVRSPALFLLILFSSIISTEALAGKACSVDTDCKGEKVCLAGSCKKLSQYESLLRLVLAAPAESAASVFIDGVYMGAMPWEGIVSAGTHSIRIEAEGMQPVVVTGTSVGKEANTIPVTLQPLPAPAPRDVTTPAAEQPADTDSDLPGTFHAGLYGGGNYGTGSWKGTWKRPVAGVQGGLAVGLRAIPDPVWLDLAFVLSSTSLKVFDATLVDGDSADWGDFVKLHFGLQARLLFPIKKNFFHIGAELEPGYGLSGARWMYVDLHLAMSLFLNQLVEIRINPLGMEYLQELQFRGYIASFHATIGIAIRFPKKRIF